MNRRTLVEFVTAWLLILIATVVILLPIFNITNVRIIFIVIISLYGVIHLVKNFLILNNKVVGEHHFFDFHIYLILFILTGILATLNLYYTNDIQVLVLGFFFLINGILELMDPIAAFLMEKKK